ncbi:hypothetical protein DFH28DRAFT_1118689 [Melampsora americana]|nr:hypothetical protein DFH28DRAFT_1118689 [Melampsora americana]
MNGLLNFFSLTKSIKSIPTQPIRTQSTLTTNSNLIPTTLPQRPTLRSSLKPLKPTTSIAKSQAQSLLKSQPSYYIKAKILGKFYRLSNHDLLTLPYIKDLKVGDLIQLTKITEIGSRSFTFKSKDHQTFLDDQWVDAKALVVEHSRGMMLTTVKKKRRKGYLKTIKNKPYFTKLRISNIDLNSDENSKPNL